MAHRCLSTRSRWTRNTSGTCRLRRRWPTMLTWSTSYRATWSSRGILSLLLEVNTRILPILYQIEGRNRKNRTFRLLLLGAPPLKKWGPLVYTGPDPHYITNIKSVSYTFSNSYYSGTQELIQEYLNAQLLFHTGDNLVLHCTVLTVITRNY